jgi:spore coat polysaccharide biosynthesis protein SpsF
VHRVIAVIQARAGSTRLPGKVLRNLGGRPVLAWVVAAAQESNVCSDVVVATTALDEDDAVAALASELGAVVVRGPVEDVLTRFVSAVDTVGARPNDVVVRLTADCPLLDPRLIAQCVRTFSPERLDYVTTDHDGTIAHGFDVEVVSVAALRRVDALASGPDRSHVTSYIVAHAEDFRVADFALGRSSVDLRVTLDEPADARLLDEVVAELGSRANEWRAVVGLLRERPDLVALNAHVGVKPLALG